MSADRAERLAAALKLSLTDLSLLLRGLCHHGAAHRISLHDPTRLGRTQHVLTYVALRAHDAATCAQFERWCREEPSISHAALLAGRCDYQLGSWHADERDANAWRRSLLMRPEVARADNRLVRVLFGHSLPGAPIFKGPPQRRAARHKTGEA